MHKPEDLVGGRYQIVKFLGGGGFGQTYLAQDIHLPNHPLCVVKHLQPTVTDAVSLETAQRLFETEAQVLYKLSDFAQIPRLLAHFREAQEFYLVQDYIEGDNLSQLLIPGLPLSEADTIALLQDILEVLIFVHQQNVIHRDLKPSNLIRRKRDGKMVLIDFGAVKQLSTQIVQVQGHTTRTIAIGSPGYMPSEQMAGRPRFCSDLYAVGMIGIQALTGLHPRELPEDPRTCEMIWRDRADVNPTLADILDKLVRYDFRERYQSAVEVLTDLSALTPQRSIQLPPIPAATIPDRPIDTRIQLVTSIEANGFASEHRLDYTHLQERLLDRDWQAADEETHRMMLQACGRSSGYLHPDDLRHFPCRDLYTIDYLWQHHSNGQFGFSVQKDIWQSVGGSTSGNYEDWDRLAKSRARWRVNTPWHRFGNRVGWRAKEAWIPHSQLIFSLDAPRGHLPSWPGKGPIAALFARLEVCQPYVPPIDITRSP